MFGRSCSNRQLFSLISQEKEVAEKFMNHGEKRKKKEKKIVIKYFRLKDQPKNYFK